MKFKHLFTLLIGALLIVFIYSCEKNELVDTKQEEVANKSELYRMSIVDNTIEVETLDKERIANFIQTKRNENNGIAQRNGNNHAVGMVNMENDMATFNAIQNNGGVHGNTHYSGEGFLIDVKFDSECLYILENKAYWGGTITVWEVADPNVVPFDVGWQIFWSAIDNGEGNDAAPDEIGDTFIIAPPDLDASVTGFSTWCEYADFDYNLYIENVHYPHGHYPGDDPTNIQID